MNNWEEIANDWLSRKRSLKGLEIDVINIFQVAFENTMIPNKSWFGFPKTRCSLNLLFGRVFLIGIYKRQIDILIDTDLNLN